MKLVNFKAEEQDIARWKKEAHREEVTLAEWIRRRLNGPIAPALAAFKSGSSGPSPATARCTHRLPKGSWCKTCQRIKK